MDRAKELDEHLYLEKNLPRKVVQFVMDRDGHMCRSCNSSEQLSCHHIIPKSVYRNHHPDNLVTLCFYCHTDIHRGLLKVRRVGNGFFFGGKLRWR